MRALLSGTLVWMLILLSGRIACFAQADGWERVKLIEPGRKVSVTLHRGKTVNGRLHAWSAEGLAVVQGKDKVVQVPKDDIAKVAMAAGMSRAKRAGYAALIGGGVGAGLISGLCARDGDCDISPAYMALGAAAWIGGISAGVAALIPQHKEVIYRAAPVK